jgi:hypothetical protein
MGSTSDLKRLNTAVDSPLWFSTDLSPFAPRGWTALTNCIRDRRTISPQTAASYSGSHQFIIQKVADLTGLPLLRFQMGALTVTGGTYSRFVDFAPLALIASIEVSYQSNVLQTFTGEDMHALFRLHFPTEKRDGYNQLWAGDLTNAQRATASASAQTWYVPLWWLFWCSSTHQYLPIINLSHELTITVTYRALADVVQTDGTSPASTLSVDMINYYWHVSAAERHMMTQMSRSGKGLQYKTCDIQRIPPYTIASGTTTVDVPLDNIKGTVFDLIFTLRKSSEISTSLANDWFNYQTFATYAILIGEDYLVRETPVNFAVNYENAEFHSAPPGALVISVPHALAVEDRLNSSGGLSYANANKPILRITFSSATAVTLVCNVRALVHNLHQLKDGDIIKAFK